MQLANQGNSRIHPLWYLAVIAVIALGMTAFLLFRSAGPTSDSLLEVARLNLARGDFRRAEELAHQAASGSNPSPWALIVAAEAALKTNRFADALDYYQRVPRLSPEASDSADFGVAEMLCHLGRISESEEQLRQLLVKNPAHKLAHLRLAFLLNITGRRWQAQPHLLYLVQNRAANVEHLLLLGNSQRQIEDRALLDATASQYPDDPLPSLGAARLALSLNRPDEAKPLLKQVLAVRPNELEALVRWGQLLLEEPDSGPFVTWSDKLSADVERHPDVWMLRGQLAQARKQPEVAARCFWEALRRDPDHLAACHQLGRTLTLLGESELAAVFLERSDILQRLASILDDLFHHRDHVESMRRAAILTRQLGRLWEAASWSSIALSIHPELTWAIEILQEVSPQLHAELPQTGPAFDPARRIDLSRYPLPSRSPSNTEVPATASGQNGSSVAHSQIRFKNDASSLGINFSYENAADDSTPGARIFETTGGGVGVMDYDRDGWPDLYLTQGGSEPGLAGTAMDRMYRNLSDHFDDITVHSRLGDRDFSQGVAAGDFDNDGFPDLYVANLGQNRLYRNQGDGTFVDVTVEAGIGESWWTTSCLVADLNGDGLPDLFDVNYAAGENLLTKICEKQGVIRSCSPRAFDPAPVTVWLNQGDGSFRNVTTESGVDVPNGLGLGIVAMDLQGEGRLSLFVANDEVPNFLFVNVTSSPEKLRFEEQAMLSGVAVDADGKSQACMGVAAGDADGDGLVDLFVTNFYQESNTFYRQIIRGQFADVTRSARLRDPGFPMLGFGTQFLDADHDGWEDLIVTNGHIDDLTAIGEPYKMPTQFFRNAGQGHFDEIPAAQLGPFFQEAHLGRGLARLDWNRDGNEDVAVSHLKEPAALLTNQASATGHFVSLQLCGTRCSRDAIGTTVEITVAGKKIVKQLTAGDGYHASNERRLVFGLGQATKVDQLNIRWPSGTIQSWNDIPAGTFATIVEGSQFIR
ncbi:MAG: FG-GAP-like repeat-containing protein [Planctomycetaceae bacterium]